MKILGIDYGRKKLGLAYADGDFADPLIVIDANDLNFLGKIIEKKKIELIVVGVSEGQSEQEARKFGEELEEEFEIEVDYADETLSTKEAQRLSIEAGHGPRKRRRMEHAFAAAIILQKYLDD